VWAFAMNPGDQEGPKGEGIRGGVDAGPARWSSAGRDVMSAYVVGVVST